MQEEEKTQGGLATMEPLAKPSMKERQRQLRENAILDAALELLSTKGYDAMTLEDITEAIGISRPTLYQHFKSKEDVVMHVSLRCKRQLWDFISMQDSSRPARDRLIEFCDYALEIRFGKQGLAMGDMMKVITAQTNQPAEMLDCEERLMRAYVQLGAQAQAEGSIRKDLSPELMSQIIVGMIKNYTFDALLAEGKITVGEIKDAARKLLLPPAASPNASLP